MKKLLLTLVAVVIVAVLVLVLVAVLTPANMNGLNGSYAATFALKRP